MSNPNEKIYLSDGAYAQITEHGDVMLTAENGVAVTDRVVLDTVGFLALLTHICRFDSGRRVVEHALAQTAAHS